MKNITTDTNKPQVNKEEAVFASIVVNMAASGLLPGGPNALRKVCALIIYGIDKCIEEAADKAERPEHSNN